MTRTFHHSSTGLRTLAILSGLVLGSCQTNAGDILATGSLEQTAQSPKPVKGRYTDPQVIAVAVGAGDQEAQLPLNEPPATLKRKPAPLAAAYTDIAEPPPEVLALQQQATPATEPAGDLGALQPTDVDTHKNSLFSAGRAPAPAPDIAASPAPATPQDGSRQAAVTATEPVSSLVPGNMPTLGVNAMSKSLFSPSADQQQMVMTSETAPGASGESLPLVEPDTGPPVLHKLSDPRPKRKILALREPTDAMPTEPLPAQEMPERVQLTPEQLAAMGAVPETAADGGTPETAMADGSEVPTSKKKKWLPSLSDLLAGGTKPKGNTR